MNNNTESKQQPLYKVLNEQRTQERWHSIATNPNHDTFKLLVYGQSEKRNGTGTLYIATLKEDTIWNYNKEEVKANAQYTALAVNNLATIAENLERILDRIEESNLQENFPSAYKRAKEALAAIS